MLHLLCLEQNIRLPILLQKPKSFCRISGRTRWEILGRSPHSSAVVYTIYLFIVARYLYQRYGLRSVYSSEPCYIIFELYYNIMLESFVVPKPKIKGGILSKLQPSSIFFKGSLLCSLVSIAATANLDLLWFSLYMHNIFITQSSSCCISCCFPTLTLLVFSW